MNPGKELVAAEAALKEAQRLRSEAEARLRQHLNRPNTEETQSVQIALLKEDRTLWIKKLGNGNEIQLPADIENLTFLRNYLNDCIGYKVRKRISDEERERYEKDQ